MAYYGPLYGGVGGGYGYDQGGLYGQNFNEREGSQAGFGYGDQDHVDREQRFIEHDDREYGDEVFTFTEGENGNHYDDFAQEVVTQRGYIDFDIEETRTIRDDGNRRMGGLSTTKFQDGGVRNGNLNTGGVVSGNDFDRGYRNSGQRFGENINNRGGYNNGVGGGGAYGAPVYGIGGPGIGPYW